MGKRRSARLAALILVATGFAAEPARGQTTATWLAGVNGNWTDATKWSTNPAYPNNGTPAGTTYDAVIDATGSPYQVTLATAVTVNTLTLAGPDATLLLNGGNIAAAGAGGISIGSGATVRNASASAGLSSTGALANAGTITAQSAFNTFTIDGVTNHGVIEVAAANANLQLTGNWSNPTGTLRVGPGTLQLGGTFTPAAIGSVIHAGGTLAITGALDNTGTTLDLDATGPLKLTEGNITGGTIVGATPLTLGQRVPNFNIPRFLSGVTLQGTISADPIASGSGTPRTVIKNNLALDGGTIRFNGGGAQISFESGSSLTGAGNVVFGYTGGLFPTAAAEMNFQPGATIAAGVSISDVDASGIGSNIGPGTIRLPGGTNHAPVYTQDRRIGITLTGTATDPMTNAAALTADNTGRLILREFSNAGVISVSQWGTLELHNMRANTGTITATGPDLTGVSITGPMTVAALGNFSSPRTSYVGTFDNTGTTLNLDTFGDMTASASEIIGGSIVAPLTNRTLQMSQTNGSTSTLRGGVSLGVDTRISTTGGFVAVFDGLTLLDNKTVTLDNGVNVAFRNGQTIGGAGEIVFGGTNSLTVGMVASPSGTTPPGFTVTIGPGVVVRTGNASGGISSSQAVIVNNGTIRSNVAGRTITLTAGTSDTNNGVIEARNRGILAIGGAWTNNGSITVDNATFIDKFTSLSGPGLFSVTNSKYHVGKTITPAQFKALQLASNEMGVAAGGTINVTGTTLDLDATTGSLHLAGGTLKGGRLTAAAGTRYIADAGTTSTLDNVTLAAPLDLANTATVSVLGTLTLDNADISMSFTSSPGSTRITTAGGPLAITGTGTITFNGTQSSNIAPSSLSTSMTIGPGVTVRTGTAGGRLGDSNGASGTFITNQGTLSATTPNTMIDISGNGLSNQGTIETRNGGRFRVAYGLSGWSGTTLGANAGTIVVGPNSTFEVIHDSRYVANAADVTLDGAGSVFAQLNELESNSGKFTIRHGRNYTALFDFANSGRLTVGKDSTLTVRDLDAGPNALGTLTNTGKLKGQGTIVAASIVSPGAIEPGESPGVLSITGNLALSASSVLTIEIGGPTPGVDYDLLDVDGALTLDGTLQISFVNGFTPTAHQQFDFLDFGTSSGAFDSVVLPPLPPGVEWDTAALAAGGPAGVPEPGSLTMIAFAGAGLLRRRRP